MSNWINVDQHFGDPFVVLEVNMRDAVISDLVQDVARYKDNPQELEKVITEEIIRHRPELKGLILVQMSLQSFGGPSRLRFVVVHPNLPKMPFGQVRTEWLIPCPVCKKGYSADSTYFMKMTAYNHCEQVCSQECADFKEDCRVHDEIIYSPVPKEL